MDCRLEREGETNPLTAIATIRAAIHQSIAVTVGETRLAANSASRLAGPVRSVLAWSAISIFLGFVVGLTAVIFPPMGTIGLVSLPLLVLLWVTPDLPVMISEKSIRRLFFAMLIVDLCVPAYYTIQIAGLPWISARRIVTFPLIVLFAIAISSSSATRQQIVTTLKDSRGIAICAFGFLVMVVLSVFTSIDPGDSLSQMSEVMLNWYVPFVALLYAIRSEKNIFLLLRIIAICALFVALAGVAEFLLQRRLFIEAMPQLVGQVADGGQSDVRRFCQCFPLPEWGMARRLGIPYSAVSG